MGFTGNLMGLTRPGQRLQFANLKIAIEIVELAIKMVIFHSYVSLPEGSMKQLMIGVPYNLTLSHFYVDKCIDFDLFSSGFIHISSYLHPV